MIKAIINCKEILRGITQNKSQDFISPNEFIEYNGKLYFTLENIIDEENVNIFEEGDTYITLTTAIEAVMEGNLLIISDDIVFLKTDISGKREFIKKIYDHTLLKENNEEIIARKKVAFQDFFRFMRAENGILNLIYDKTIIPFIKMVLETEDNLLFDVNGKTFNLTLLDAFSIHGELEVKAYDSLYLGNITINDFYGEKEICDIPGISLYKNITIEDDECEDYLLEALLDSMGENEVVNYIIKAIDQNC